MLWSALGKWPEALGRNALSSQPVQPSATRDILANRPNDLCRRGHVEISPGHNGGVVQPLAGGPRRPRGARPEARRDSTAQAPCADSDKGSRSAGLLHLCHPSKRRQLEGGPWKSHCRNAAILKAAIGIGLAQWLLGPLSGAISVGSLTLAQTMVLSLVMFTGASQFAFVGVATAGGSPCSCTGKPAAGRPQRVLWRTSF